MVVVRDLEASLRFYWDGIGLNLLQDRHVEGDWPDLFDAPSRRVRAVFLGDAGVPAPGAPVPPILPPKDGFIFLDRAKFHASFAGDVPAEQAAFLADSHVPWGVDALSGSITEPAWRTKQPPPLWPSRNGSSRTASLCREPAVR